MSTPVAGKWVTVTILSGQTSVTVGKNTHGFPYKPEVYMIVGKKTAAAGNGSTSSYAFWDTTASDTGDGGNAVAIAVSSAPTVNQIYDVLLGPTRA